MASINTRQYRPRTLLGSESRKGYNNIDSKEQLLLVEINNERFGGYRRDLLVHSLTEVEIDFYVCTTCMGIMCNACHVGEEQTPVCEGCVREGVISQPMMRSRKKIPQLVVRCPLATRGCNWNGTLAEVEEHLNVCVEIVVNCVNCNIILQRRDLINHLTNLCVNREVTCKFCCMRLFCKNLTGHYDVCTEYEVHCPNECRTVLKQRQLKVHMETECPNTTVECYYRKFGCNQKMKTCDLKEHYRTNEIMHLRSTTQFAINKMEEMEMKINSSDNIIQKIKKESDNKILELQEKIKSSENKIQQMEKKIASSDKLMKQMEQKIGFSDIDYNIPTEAISELEEKVTTITKNMNKLLYPIVLRYTFKMDSLLLGEPTCKITCSWSQYKIHVLLLINKEIDISVAIKMENDNTIATCFEGRFRLTIYDRKDTTNSLIYETPVTKLQFQDSHRSSIHENSPSERSPRKQHSPELVIANVPQELLFDERFITNNEAMFTLQIQHAEDCMIKYT